MEITGEEICMVFLTRAVPKLSGSLKNYKPIHNCIQHSVMTVHGRSQPVAN